MSSKFGKWIVTLVALIHAGIAVTEMFFWTRPEVHQRLDALLTSPDVAVKAAPIVANAGLYNGFLAAGLLWGLRTREGGTRIQAFFLWCVVVAGIVGTITLKDWIPLAAQTVPAAAALIAMRNSAA